MPTLSVLSPNYNYGRYLRRALDAVISQSRPPDEYIVLDDGSTDDSAAILAEYEARVPFLKVIRHEKNRGIAAATSRMLQEAKGDYLYLTASDDYFEPGAVEAVMRMAETYPQAGILVGQLRQVDEAGRLLDLLRSHHWDSERYVDPETYYREWLLGESSTHSLSGSTVFRRDAFLELGGFRQDLGCWQDTFLLRAIGMKYGVAYLPRPIISCMWHAGSYAERAHANPWLMLDTAARVRHLMQSPPFDRIFPDGYPARWEADFRRAVIEKYLDGILHPSEAAGRAYRRAMVHAGVPGRSFAWGVGTLHGLCRHAMFWSLGRTLRGYPGDVSCFTEAR